MMIYSQVYTNWRHNYSVIVGSYILGLFCNWEGRMCVISWCSKWPSDLNAKPQTLFSPAASKSSRAVISHSVFTSSVCREDIRVGLNVTCDIWQGLSALFDSHCVEMNESFFQISYRDALCGTIETPLRPLN